jgi:hypothetical protein
VSLLSKDAWDIVEVKSSTEVKDVNLLDLAFQAFVYNGAGLKIRRCCLMHVSRDYVRRGPVDPKKFFKIEDVTKDVSGLSREIEPRLDDMFRTIRRKQEPDIQIGPHCSDPYACPLQDACWAFLPAGSVCNLYYGGKKCWRLFGDGITRLRDIPDHVDLTDRQAIQRKVALTGQPHIDRRALATFLIPPLAATPALAAFASSLSFKSMISVIVVARFATASPKRLVSDLSFIGTSCCASAG